MASTKKKVVIKKEADDDEEEDPIETATNDPPTRAKMKAGK